MKIPTIFVTDIEAKYLYDERLRAGNECPDLVWQTSRRDKKKGPICRNSLEVYGRDRDGCIRAAFKITVEGHERTYRRKLRVPATYGSTSPRRLELRRTVNSG